MNELSAIPVPPAEAPPPVVPYATEQKLIPKPELAAIGFFLLAMPYLGGIGVAAALKLFPPSRTLIMLYNVCEQLLMAAGYLTVLYAFRNSRVRLKWLHASLLAAIAGHWFFYLVEIAVSMWEMHIPASSAGATARMFAFVSPTIEILSIAITVLWTIFLSRLARAMRTPFLHVVMLLLLSVRALISCIWALISLDLSLSYLGLFSSSHVHLTLSIMSTMSLLSRIFSLPLIALFAWYAFAVYHSGRTEGSVIAPA